MLIMLGLLVRRNAFQADAVVADAVAAAADCLLAVAAGDSNPLSLDIIPDLPLAERPFGQNERREISALVLQDDEHIDPAWSLATIVRHRCHRYLDKHDLVGTGSASVGGG
jgi:hypothetical protein